MFLTAQKHVSHDYQVWGDFASEIALFMLDFVQCPALISSPAMKYGQDKHKRINS